MLRRRGPSLTLWSVSGQGALLLAASLTAVGTDAKCAGAFQQCGGGTGIGSYMGPGCCVDGYNCTQNSFFPGNQYYHGYWECTPANSPFLSFMVTPPEMLREQEKKWQQPLQQQQQLLKREELEKQQRQQEELLQQQQQRQQQQQQQEQQQKAAAAADAQRWLRRGAAAAAAEKEQQKQQQKKKQEGLRQQAEEEATVLVGAAAAAAREVPQQSPAEEEKKKDFFNWLTAHNVEVPAKDEKKKEGEEAQVTQALWTLPLPEFVVNYYGPAAPLVGAAVVGTLVGGLMTCKDWLRPPPPEEDSADYSSAGEAWQAVYLQLESGETVA